MRKFLAFIAGAACSLSLGVVGSGRTDATVSPMVSLPCEPLPSHPVTALHVLPDDRILVAEVAPGNSFRLIRRGVDGKEDATFLLASSAVTARINDVTTSASHIYIGGAFTSTSAISSSYVARLNLDGTTDSAWNAAVGDTLKTQVNTLLADSDGGLLVGGIGGLLGVGDEAIVRIETGGASSGSVDQSYISRSSNGGRASRLARIPGDTDIYALFSENGTFGVQRIPRAGATNSAGTGLNGGWYYQQTSPTTDGDGYGLAVTADGHAVATGRTMVVTIDHPTAQSDQTFRANTNGGAAARADLQLAAHTRAGTPGFVVAGRFDTFAGVSVSGVARINADGTPDTVFNTNVSKLAFSTTTPMIEALGVLSDGRIVAGGGHTWPGTFQVSQSAIAPSLAQNLFRLNADGTIDPDFNVDVLPAGGCPQPLTPPPPAAAPGATPVVLPPLLPETTAAPQPTTTAPTTTVPTTGPTSTVPSSPEVPGATAPQLVSPQMADELASAPGSVTAMIDGEPVAAEQVRVDLPAAAVPPARRTPEQVADIQAAAADLAARFNEGDDSAQITIVNTETGAEVQGLLVDRDDPTVDVAVPVEDVVLVTAGDTKVLLAGADELGRPVPVPTGVLEVTDGGQVAALAKGFDADTPGEVVLLSTPRLVGSFITAVDGAHRGQYALPADIEPGEHTLVLTTGDRTVALGLIVAGANGEAPVAPPAPEPQVVTLPATGTDNGLTWWVPILVLTGVALLGMRRRLV